MAIERIDLAWEDVTEEDGTQLRRPKLPALPDGYYCARSGFEDHPPTQHPADDEHPEPWIEPDPRPAQAWYDYQPIPTPPAWLIATHSRRSGLTKGAHTWARPPTRTMTPPRWLPTARPYAALWQA
jgi:hypothetical protein